MIAAGVDQPPLSTMIPIDRYDVEAGYSRWAPRDDGPNPAIEAEAADLPHAGRHRSRRAGRRARCRVRHGTARGDPRVELGWEVVGVDRTDAMVDAREGEGAGARRSHPGLLQSLPLEDASVDLVTCGLALTHVEDLGPVFAEFARVLRTGGQRRHHRPAPRHQLARRRRRVPDRGSPSRRGQGRDADDPLRHQPGAPGERVPRRVHRPPGCGSPAATNLASTRRVVSFMPAFGAFPDAARQAFLGLPYLLVWELELTG